MALAIQIFISSKGESFGGRPKGLTVWMNFKILKYILGPVKVNLIRKDDGRKVAEAVFEKLNL